MAQALSDDLRLAFSASSPSSRSQTSLRWSLPVQGKAVTVLGYLAPCVELDVDCLLKRVRRQPRKPDFAHELSPNTMPDPPLDKDPRAYPLDAVLLKYRRLWSL